MHALLRLFALLLIPVGLLALLPPPGTVSAVMLALITVVALVIDRYADRYLQGQGVQRHFRRWFVVTVAAASLLVVVPDLRVLALAWTASSLSLHQLLTYFSERPQAQVAAHKKFLLSRLADVAIYGAVFLLGRALGTYDLDLLLARAGALPSLPPMVVVAGYLLVTGIILRAAQLPFHGWLIQVMEAPTPVSALLHAGVVNIGGFVLIRLAPLIGQLHGARSVLVIVGALTAALAALVGMTRVSVKVSLAWSTASQMGFMLLECGLGAWKLALLHLVAHSLYKAHAFLGSGSVVSAYSAHAGRGATRARTVRHWIVGVLAGALLATGTVAVSGPVAWTQDATAVIAASIFSLALAPVLAGVSLAGGWRLATAPVAVALLMCLALAASHEALRAVALAAAPPVAWHLVFTLLVFGLLLLMQVILDLRPTGAVATWMYPLVFAGFHLDAIFTRATFRLWPPQATPRRRAAAATSPTTKRRAA